MDGSTSQISEVVREQIKEQYHMDAGSSVSATLFLLLTDPEACHPQAILDALGSKVKDPDYLSQLPAEKFVEFLILMHVLEQRVPSTKTFTDFHEIIAAIAIRRIKTADWSFWQGGVSVLSYFTLLNGATDRSIHLEKLLLTYDKAFVGGLYNTVLDRKADEVLNDYSLTNGVTGVLIGLIKACQQGKTSKRIWPIVQSLMVWVKAQISAMRSNIIDVNWESANVSFFPMRIEKDSEIFQVSNELSWSEGDLGHVYLLYLASELWNEPEYYRIAERIGMYTLLRRDFVSTGVKHATFKHGSAGLTYAYDALWRYSHNDKYRQNALFWHQQTRELVVKDMHEGYYQQTFFDLFDGVTGIALVDQAMGREGNRPDWMSMLLL